MEDNAARKTTTRSNAWHTLCRVGSFAGWTDGQLLERFAESQGRDEVGQRAFETLVERHGGAVLRVSRAVLRDPHEADDAFQATFLVLARRSRSIRDREAVGAWLLGVAYRVAGCARAARIRRTAHEQTAARTAGRYTTPDEPNDWAPLLREEIAGLPEKFRLPLVLCYLDGLAQDEVARRLGWPIGTVRSRLARGRDRLRRRLILRGVTPAIAATAVTTWRETIAASLSFPRALVNWSVESLANSAMGSVSTSISTSTSTSTIGAATAAPPVIALTREVLRTMLWTRLRLHAAAWLTAGLLAAAGAGTVAGRAGVFQEPGRGDGKNSKGNMTRKGNANATRPPASHDILLVYKVIVDRLKAANLGVTTEDVRKAIAAAFELPDPMTHRMVWTSPDDGRVIFVRKQTPDGAFISFEKLLDLQVVIRWRDHRAQGCPLRNLLTVGRENRWRLEAEVEACEQELAAAEAELKPAGARVRRARASLVAARDRLRAQRGLPDIPARLDVDLDVNVPGSERRPAPGDNLALYVVKVDRIKAAHWGVTTEVVRRAIADAFESPHPMSHPMVWIDPTNENQCFVRVQALDGVPISLEKLLDLQVVTRWDGGPPIQGFPLRRWVTVDRENRSRLKAEVEACEQELAASEAELKRAEARARRARASMAAVRDRLRAQRGATAPPATGPDRPAATRKSAAGDQGKHSAMTEQCIPAGHSANRQP